MLRRTFIQFTASVCVIVLVGMSHASSTFAATATANPAGDVFVCSANADSNFGAAGALEVSPSGLLKGEFQSVMKFNMSGAKAGFDAAYGPGQWSVQFVSLQLVSASPINPIFNTSAAGAFAMSWMQDDSWAGAGGSARRGAAR